jgi:hypothetical protein
MTGNLQGLEPFIYLPAIATGYGGNQDSQGRGINAGQFHGAGLMKVIPKKGTEERYRHASQCPEILNKGCPTTEAIVPGATSSFIRLQPICCCKTFCETNLEEMKVYKY